MPAFWDAVWLHLTELGLAAGGLLALVGAGEGLRRWGVSAEVTRRVVHAGVGLFVVATPWLFAHPAPVYVLAGGFVLANGVAWWKGWLPGIHAARRESVGTITFPLVLLPALVVGWSLDGGRVWALQVSFLLLALCDPLAAWVGQAVRRPRPYRIGTHTKSVAGSGAFGVAAALLTMTALMWAQAEGMIRWSLAEIVVVSGTVAGGATAAEALGDDGWDNVTIVLAALFALVYADEHPEARTGMGLAMLAGVVFGIVAYQVGSLDRSGAVAGGLLAWSLLAVEGWAWAVPGFTFFVLSSALSRMGASRKATVEARIEKPGARDVGQVLANGGVAWLLLLAYVAYPAAIWYLGFLGAFAAATADTWATELGALSTARPRLLTTGARVPTGTSGAVSLAGTAASVLGAATIALVAWPFLAALALTDNPMMMMLVVTGAGVAGALTDSLLGATVQAQFVDPQTGIETERPPPSNGAAKPVRGWRWLHNDQVNLIGTATGAAVALACFPWL
ncbi:MAG: DUF92 domain-containing protein [Bacteroidetes bacterium]|jgi:uncharacterized protein (TIGR00297 family)|nr:DUF92 domain-containing protein [Bacteroidota bacterium]